MVFVGVSAMFSSCIKNGPMVTTINPSMTASVGDYNFTAATVVPSTLDSQVNDTSTTLIITGYSNDKAYPRDKIVLVVSNYRGVTGLFSMAQGYSNAYYWHSGVRSDAAGGIVSITKITPNSIIGYFSFTTVDDQAITEGNFNVGKPGM
jgi:hypothetical protein